MLPQIVQGFAMKMHDNTDAIRRILAADCGGVPNAALKPLYILRNTIGIAPDTPIHRIVQSRFLLEDLRAGQLAHTRIDSKNWGDDNENPLRNKSYTDGATGGTFRLGVADEMFGSCWSQTPLDDYESWSTFSGGKNSSVRIESTPRRVLAAIMQTGDRFYSLRHIIAKVQYLSRSELDAHFSDPDIATFLGSWGEGLANAMTLLGTGFHREDEVRLLYNHSPDDEWSKANVRVSDKYAWVGFDWSNVIEKIVVGPFVALDDRAKLESQFRALGITCPLSCTSASANLGWVAGDR